MDSVKRRCINLDWLEVYVLEDVDRMPCDASYYQSRGYVVHEREYGTRVYAEMFTIDDDHGQPWLEVRRRPLSLQSKSGGLFPSNASHIRLSNYACYRDDAISSLRDFLALHGYTFVKIFRADICLDFERFDSHDDPARFIARFMAGRYSKVNLTNINAHGQDTWGGRVWHSLSWGCPTSMISTKIYCKSLELRQVHDKPYIRWAWYQSGLTCDPISNCQIDDTGRRYTPDIWRLEFSIKSSARRWFLIERSDVRKGKIPMPYTLEVFETRSRLLLIFASLCQHYFRFKHYESGRRKDRCRDKVLFQFDLSSQYVSIKRYVKGTKPDSRIRRIAAMLVTFRMFTNDTTARSAIDTLLHYIDTLRLSDMVDITSDDVHVKALQALLRERMQGVTSEATSQRLTQLVNIFSDDVEVF